MDIKNAKSAGVFGLLPLNFSSLTKERMMVCDALANNASKIRMNPARRLLESLREKLIKFTKRRSSKKRAYMQNSIGNLAGYIRGSIMRNIIKSRLGYQFL
jgi:hypothetical protein